MFTFLKKIFAKECKTCSPSSDKRHDLKHAEKEQLVNQSEKQIDKTNEQSFPASDPPTNY